jgi:antitoxin YefM
MPEASLSFARAHLAKLCDEVAASREPLIIRRRKAEDVAIVAVHELSSLLETAHLLRSPRNARRLLKALEAALRGEGERLAVDKLRAETGLERPGR